MWYVANNQTDVLNIENNFLYNFTRFLSIKDYIFKALEASV